MVPGPRATKALDGLIFSDFRVLRVLEAWYNIRRNLAPEYHLPPKRSGMEEVRNGNKLLAIVWRDSDWTPGLNFPTPDDFFIQAGCGEYPAGKQLAAHRHKNYERTVTQTQEVVFVKRGRMKVFVYLPDNTVFSEVDLETGDFMVLGDCGHGYEILEDGTQILETKNGPFIDVDTDKTKF